MNNKGSSKIYTGYAKSENHPLSLALHAANRPIHKRPPSTTGKSEKASAKTVGDSGDEVGNKC
jgi:hypothetical protein